MINWGPAIGAIGLVIEIGGVFYLSRALFVNGIRRVYFVEDNIAKFSFLLRSACKILRIKQQNIRTTISNYNTVEWGQLSPEAKKIIYEPFLGFFLLLFGLIFQIGGLLISISKH